MSRLKTALAKAVSYESRKNDVYGTLGKIVNGNRVYETGRPGFTWVTLDNGTIHEAINTNVSWLGATALRVKMVTLPNGVLKVVDLDDLRDLAITGSGAASAAAKTPPHSHNISNTALYDPVSTRRIAEGLVYHRPGDNNLAVSITGWRIIVDGTYHNFAGAFNFDLSSLQSVLAANENRYAIVFLDSDYATPVATGSTPTTGTLGDADIQECLTAASLNAIPLAAIRLYDGQTVILNADIVNDLRQVINTRGAGGGDLTAKFLVQQADPSLPNAQAMGALTTGIVKNTTTTGVQSIATGPDLPTMTGDSGSGGLGGAVPAPGAGDAAAGKFLKADATWTTPPSPPAFATPSIALGSSAAAGAASTVIRSDSTIAAFDATNPTSSAPGDAVAVGSAAFAARRDHKHGREAWGLSGDIGSEAFGASAAAGSSGKVADAGHVHPMPANPVSFATPSIALGSAAAAGAAGTVIRSDSTITAFDTTVPGNSAPGDAAAVGVIAFAARRDHKHGRESWGGTGDMGAEAIGSSVAAGSSGKVSDAGHVHAMPAAGLSGDIGSETFGASAAAGSTGKIADAGHVHSLPSLKAVMGRLTLTSGTPVTTSDVTGATTVYFTPFGGDHISLYDGSKWVTINFTEKSVAVPSTTNTLYDVFGYLSSGDLALETLAWNVPTNGTITNATNATPIVVTYTGTDPANDQIVTIAGVGGNTAANGTWRVGSVNTGAKTFQLITLAGGNSTGNGAFTTNGTWQRRDENQTRATALVWTSGLLTKSGDQTRLYLGTIGTTTTSGQCEDSAANRLLWNKYNKVPRVINKLVSSSHTYTTSAWRAWNNDFAARTYLISGYAEDAWWLGIQGSGSSDIIGATINATGSPDVSMGNGSTTSFGMSGFGQGSPFIGRLFAQAVETGTGTAGSFSDIAVRGVVPT